MSWKRPSDILAPVLPARHRWYGLEPGTLLRQCSSGFTWNTTLHGSETVPVEVRVVKEYEAHILVKAKLTCIMLITNGSIIKMARSFRSQYK